MDINKRQPFATLIRRGVVAVVCAAGILVPRMTQAQGLTGTLIGTVRDQQGGALAGAQVRVSSPNLIGGPLTLLTSDKGHLRFPALPPGSYALDIELQGFRPFHEEHILIGVGTTIETMPVLLVEGVVESLVVEGAVSRIDARNPGFWTRIRSDDLRTIPTRRSSMFDAIRFTPGISPTSPSSGTVFTVSAFGSGTNENQFLLDGGNFTCPCNGIARSEPGVDFIQEIQIQSVGASAEFGNVQGAVINVVTRQGSNRFQSDLAYYGQTAGLTSQPLRLRIPGTTRESGYGRARFRDVTATLGGPVVRERLWFFAGYQHLRDYASQPGTDPALPRKYEQDKILAKLTWNLAPGWQLVQSFYDEFWANPEQPTLARPFDATVRRTATVPAMTFGHLTHTGPANTVWDVRAGRFVFDQKEEPSTGDRTRPGRTDSVGPASGAPQTFGNLTLIRTNAKATLTHYRPGLLGADHQWKMGGQVERGEHHSSDVIPTGERFIDANGQKSEVVSSPPSNIGGVFVTVAAFASDAITLNDWLTINAGLRFDHSRAISQDLPTVDLQGQETGTIVQGRGTLYTWNLWSPRLGVTAKIGADGRTIARASYGRFSQGVLTGEIQAFHPGATAVTTTAFDPATGTYSGASRTVDASNLRLDPGMRAPHTDEFSVGLDREIGRQLAVAVAYVRKDGRDFIGWTDVGGSYLKGTRTLFDGRTVPVHVLDNSPADRRFLLTNPNEYLSLTYNGLVMVVEKRRSHGWQAFGSYTWSKAYGLQSSSGTSAAGAQASTVAPPPSPAGVTFGRDPNDLTNARGRLPNDRPHMFRVMGSAEVPRTGVNLSASLQHFSGKPWAATAVVSLPQTPTQRILLEPRGSRRLSPQSLLDLRVSRAFTFGGVGRIELLLDVLNVLNDTAEEGLFSDVLMTERAKPATFGVHNVFIDPRRVMVGVRLNLGR